MAPEAACCTRIKGIEQSADTLLIPFELSLRDRGMPELDWKAWGARRRGLVAPEWSASCQPSFACTCEYPPSPEHPAPTDGRPPRDRRLHPLRSYLSPLEESKVPPQTGVYGRLVTFLAEGL